mmetsp:Transcript_27466/g.72178  ORF Transcript_27466/g.72178 Transcript_27466/m.72178 type:complete len:311 (+) Transcript_27466:226-1158(+)|eukprot:CAMPEP_0182924268 /NCGR_PEP_ID=MMETSP0105_2-20130417/5941_1 /TAXON_ID=81532 ORGANISM="Acanthoeca-like sp., Strain 10tr" /NCGR_SAMPLE_ID=MMETSP0105_2 /ASSEMBLY_ACC=CAM_ASM_000205 /LENGTH=310 /DNA_ID=CAMNT_0025062033 /DNA_START=122 /DNA_END=1054 /DNA_ORIENTATION=+
MALPRAVAAAARLVCPRVEHRHTLSIPLGPGGSVAFFWVMSHAAAGATLTGPHFWAHPARSLMRSAAVQGRTTHHAAKNLADAKRGKLFARLSRDIAIAARLGGPDLEANPRLAAAVALAKKERVPKEKIERALLPGGTDAEAVYTIEATAAGGGAALLIETTIEPKQRVGLEANDLRKFISKQGGTIKESGTLQYLFEEKFVVDVSDAAAAAAAVGDPEELAIEVGAEDATSHAGGFTLVADKAADTQATVLDGLAAAGVEYDEAEVRPMAITSHPLDVEGAETLAELLDALVDHPSVASIVTNVDLDR